MAAMLWLLALPLIAALPQGGFENMAGFSNSGGGQPQAPTQASGMGGGFMDMLSSRDRQEIQHAKEEVTGTTGGGSVGGNNVGGGANANQASGLSSFLGGGDGGQAASSNSVGSSSVGGAAPGGPGGPGNSGPQRVKGPNLAQMEVAITPTRRRPTQNQAPLGGMAGIPGVSPAMDVAAPTKSSNPSKTESGGAADTHGGLYGGQGLDNPHHGNTMGGADGPDEIPLYSNPGHKHQQRARVTQPPPTAPPRPKGPNLMEMTSHNDNSNYYNSRRTSTNTNTNANFLMGRNSGSSSSRAPNAPTPTSFSSSSTSSGSIPGHSSSSASFSSSSSSPSANQVQFAPPRQRGQQSRLVPATANAASAPKPTQDPNAGTYQGPNQGPSGADVGPAGPDMAMMTNRFTAGVDKVGSQAKYMPIPVAGASQMAGLEPIPGLNVPLYASAKNANAGAGSNGNSGRNIKPCNAKVDVVFALDSLQSLWLAKDSIRFYETNLLPSRQARFGVVLCGELKSFYTELHTDFGALLASLEDLQHANATLDPSDHYADTPGVRHDNNPYPPRVSENFQQADSSCLDTVYALFGYTSVDSKTERLLTVIGTKLRWGNPRVVREAQRLQQRNISMITLVGSRMPRYAKSCLKNMASSQDRFRDISDNVTSRAMPSMLGNAICRPHKADVTLSIARTALGKVSQPVVVGCRQVNSTSLERTRDFGPFGHQTERFKCVAGFIPDPQHCKCV